MAKVSMKKLLESGVHFGHRTHRWNPKMKPYIFTERNGIHIIDLQQTAKSLTRAYKLVSNLVAEGGTVLFVGTKRQAQETIEIEAQRAGMPYVAERWLGGMLTNWSTMRQRVREMERIERMRESGDFERITKKEGLILTRKMDKLEARFGGIRDMHKQPDLVFIVDVRREETAVAEANTLNIPILALVDTNCDPSLIDHVVPSNDDAIRTIKLLVAFIADAVIEGKDRRKGNDEEAQPVAEKKTATKAKEATLDEEKSDDELLGAATLAKMEAAADEVPAVEETAAEAPVAEVEATEETAKEEIAAEAPVAEVEATEEAAKEETAEEAPVAEADTTEEAAPKAADKE